jgi:hypothetical protein
MASSGPPVAGQVVHADRLHLLQRPRHLLGQHRHGLDARQLQPQPHQVGALAVVGGHSGGVACGFGLEPALLSLRQHQRGVGLRLRLCALALGFHAQAQRVSLGVLGHARQRQQPVAFGHRLLALRVAAFLRQQQLRARLLLFDGRQRFVLLLAAQRHGLLHALQLQLQLRLQPRPIEHLLALDLGLRHAALALQPSLLDLALRLLALTCDVGFGACLLVLDHAPQRQLGLLLFLLNLDAPLVRQQLRLRHRHLGVGLGVRALLLVGGDDLGQPPHAHSIEHVVLVERAEGRLVELHKRGRFEPQAVV